MSNSNSEPMPFRRQFGGAAGSGIAPPEGRSLAQLEAASAPPTGNEDAFVDASGFAIVKPVVTGACRKCGYPGHLPYQCRNFIQLKPNQSTVIDVSSTSSESETEETPLVKKARKLKRKLEKKAKKEKKKEKKREKKKLRKEKKKLKKRRRTRSSSSESDSSYSDSEYEKKKKRRRRDSSGEDERSKHMKHSKSKRRRRSSSSSSSD